MAFSPVKMWRLFECSGGTAPPYLLVKSFATCGK
jgi:hypothetical protein